ncbi:MAG TPA: ParB/RepB/Spo0J family partition protein [Patescibacteria group bacterium]|nr:ParB/RepB/Spo0J family partition protein [Patescibacteria group bacterium]
MAKPKSTGASALSMINRARTATAGIVAIDAPSPALAEDAQVPPAASPTGVDLKQRILALDLIEPNPHQPRRIVDDAGQPLDPVALGELAQSIARFGILQPILVRPLPGDRFCIVAGERRWRAARLAGKTHIPVAITDSDDVELLALLENIQREDLSPVELATYLHRLKEGRGIRQDQLAEIIGKSKSYVSRMLAILSLPQSIIDEMGGHRDKLSSKLLTEIVDAGIEDIQLALWDQVKQGASANTVRLIKQLPPDILDELAAYQSRISVKDILTVIKEDSEEGQRAAWDEVKNAAPLPRASASGQGKASSTAQFVAHMIRAAKAAHRFTELGFVLAADQLAEMESARAALDEAIRAIQLRRRN